MKRRRFTQTESLQQRLASFAAAIDAATAHTRIGIEQSLQSSSTKRPLALDSGLLNLV
ncbi:hypothetical protein [Bradyrhizobium mercantei]|uniref:hypothetical protein n=1 Tax=Bradyrhizobium mercantei TaxID=1904807 RepID=UPI00135661F1|nr:hypothetical protein [Bradyrhizobium mercantei]